MCNSATTTHLFNNTHRPSFDLFSDAIDRQDRANQPLNLQQALVESYGLPASLLTDPLTVHNTRPHPLPPSTPVKRPRGRPPKNRPAAEKKDVPPKDSNAKRSYSKFISAPLPTSNDTMRPKKIQKTAATIDETAEDSGIKTPPPVINALAAERLETYVQDSADRFSQSNASAVSSNNFNEVLPEYQNTLLRLAGRAPPAPHAFTNMVDRIANGQNLQLTSPAKSITAAEILKNIAAATEKEMGNHGHPDFA
jgi:hypothetical protein